MRSKVRKFGLVFFMLVGRCFASVLPAGMSGAEGTAAARPAVQIEHLPVTFGEQGKAIVLQAELQAPGRAVVYVRIYFRKAAESSFRFVDMRPAARGYIGEIPGSHVQPPSLQYFLLALLNDQTIVSVPSRNPYGHPFEVLITAPAGPEREQLRPAPAAPAAPEMGGGRTQPGAPANETEPGDKPETISPQLLEKLRQLEAPLAEQEAGGETVPEPAAQVAANGRSDFLILSPEALSTVPAGEALIAVSFEPHRQVVPNSVRVMLDGVDCTARADISEVLVALDPGKLPEGEHQVSVTARDAAGAQLGPVRWRFFVGRMADEEQEEQERSQLVSGVAFVDLQHEKFGGSSLDNNAVGANLTGRHGLISYEAAAYFTSLEDERYQPRHRFTLTAGVPWLTVTLGDATPYLNELVLWGRRVRGVQARLYTGWLNLDLVKGETVRAVAPATTGAGGTFRQTLLGVRPSFGGQHFQLGFILLKASDDTTSIEATAARVAPRSNLVAGADLTLAVDRRRFEIRASAAHSFVSNNTLLPVLSKSFIDSVYNVELPIDPARLTNWVVVNESLTPLDPRGGAALAYQAGVSMNYFGHYVNAGFKQIGSQYTSFGHAYLRKDIRGFFVSDRWRMLRNRLYFTLGWERYRDHFDEVDEVPGSTLHTLQFGVAVNWAPGLPSLNFNFRNHNRDHELETLALAGVDSLVAASRPDNTRMRDYTFMLTQEVQAFNLAHAVSLGLNSAVRVDSWRVTPAAGTGDVVTSLQTVTLRTRYHMPLTTTLSFATNSNKAGGQLAPLKYHSLLAQAEYLFPRPQLRAYAGLRLVGASGKIGTPGAVTATVIDYTQFGLQAGGGLTLARRHEVVLDLGLLRFNDQGGTQNSSGTFTQKNAPFTSAYLRAHYEYRF